MINLKEEEKCDPECIGRPLYHSHDDRGYYCDYKPGCCSSIFQCSFCDRNYFNHRKIAHYREHCLRECDSCFNLFSDNMLFEEHIEECKQNPVDKICIKGSPHWIIRKGKEEYTSQLDLDYFKISVLYEKIKCSPNILITNPLKYKDVRCVHTQNEYMIPTIRLEIPFIRREVHTKCLMECTPFYDVIIEIILSYINELTICVTR